MQVKGFSLIEIMVTLALVAILATVAVPNFFSFVQNNRMGGWSNTLLLDLYYARSEAVSRGNNVILCPKTTTNTCDLVTQKDWSLGWIIFADTNADGIMTADETLKIQEALPVGANLSRNVNTVLAGRITYTSRSTITPTANTGNFTLCDSVAGNKVTGRTLTISSIGKVQVEEKKDCV